MSKTLTTEQSDDLHVAIARIKALEDQLNVKPMQDAEERERIISKMKTYDIYLGFWEAREQIMNPFTKEMMILKWEFVRSKDIPVRAGVKIHDADFKLFNESRRLRTAGVQTSQLFPAGEKIQIFDEIPNPFVAKTYEPTKIAPKAY